MGEAIEIRDLRKQDWIWTSKTLLFHKDVDGNGYKVYCGLAAYADNRTQEAFPSIDTLAERLHIGRNTVIRALQKLELVKVISVERETGKHNVYCLLDIQPEDVPRPNKRSPEEPRQATPGDVVRYFFKGMNDCRLKLSTEQSESVKLLLLRLTEKYPKAAKEDIWIELKKFERYWTESNRSGTKQKWEFERAFELDRRLVTWFTGKASFTKGGGKGIDAPKGAKVGKL